MTTNIINKSTVQFALSCFLVFGAILFIFTPDLLYFKWVSNYAVLAMLGYLFLGLLCLVTRNPRLMFINFACCAALCVFLNTSVENAFTHNESEKTEGIVISIAHFNASRAGISVNESINLIKKTGADLVSVQELTADEAEELSECMEDDYPYLVAIPDTSFYGMAIFSKYPLHAIDTFQFNGKPNMTGKIRTPAGELYFLSAHTFPAKDQTSLEKLVEHLDIISQKIQKTSLPLITLGEYNAVSWSPEIRAFKSTSGLNDSRKGAAPTFPKGELHLFELPIDHIFFTDHLECLNFKTLDHEKSPHFGIIGTYRFKPKVKVLNASEKT